MSHFQNISANESFRAAAEEGMYKVLKHYAEQYKSNSPCFIKFNLSKNKSGETFTLNADLSKAESRNATYWNYQKDWSQNTWVNLKSNFLEDWESVPSQPASKKGVCKWVHYL